MPWDYSEKTRQLFIDCITRQPGTHMGEIKDPDGFGRHGSIACGDALEFYFKVEKNPDDPRKDKIIEARFMTFGCTSAIASSEALCRLVESKGYTPIQALGITNADIVDYLEGLPPEKLHCSVMGAEALQAAVVDWARKRGVPIAELGLNPDILKEDEGRLVCKCFNLTEPYIKRKIKEMNLKNVEEVSSAIKAGGACGTCRYEPGGIQDMLDEIWGKQPKGESSQARKGKTPFQLAKEIEQVLELEIAPILGLEGGGIEIVEIRGKKVYVSLHGACSGCAGATMTLRFLVEERLRALVDPEIQVIEV